MLILANTLYPVLALIAMAYLAHRNRVGFIIFLFVEILMFYIGTESKQYGLAVMAVLYFIMNIYSWIKWRNVS